MLNYDNTIDIIQHDISILDNVSWVSLRGKYPLDIDDICKFCQFYTSTIIIND